MVRKSLWKLVRRKEFLGLFFFLGVVFLLYQVFSANQIGYDILRRQAVQGSADKGHHQLNNDILLDMIVDEDDEVNKQRAAVAGKHVAERHNKQVAANASPILGVLPANRHLYLPNKSGKFYCVITRKEIPLGQVNDDYCDCDDGTDEPSTSACLNGRFYCTHQGGGHTPLSVLSSQVNDGICDCCDGSDEWLSKKISREVQLGSDLQKRLGVFQTPCSDRCSQLYDH